MSLMRLPNPPMSIAVAADETITGRGLPASPWMLIELKLSSSPKTV